MVSPFSDYTIIIAIREASIQEFWFLLISCFFLLATDDSFFGVKERKSIFFDRMPVSVQNGEERIPNNHDHRINNENQYQQHYNSLDSSEPIAGYDNNCTIITPYDTPPLGFE